MMDLALIVGTVLLTAKHSSSPFSAQHATRGFRSSPANRALAKVRRHVAALELALSDRNRWRGNHHR